MQIKLLNFGAIQMPTRAHHNDAGYDVFAKIEVIIAPHHVSRIPLGFGVEVPAGFMANIYPRGGQSLLGLLPQLPPIDCGYTGEVHAITLNANDYPVVVQAGQKIGQLVFVPITHFDLAEETEAIRGAAGFGSTDKK